MAKRSKRQKLKDAAWEWFSRFIRLSAADHAGNVKCVTCGAVKHWKEMQAGHFVAGRGYAVLFDEDLVYPQCYHCNIGLGGNYVEYFKFMRTQGWTEDELYRMNAKRHTVVKVRDSELADLRDLYRQKVKSLEGKVCVEM